MMDVEEQYDKIYRYCYFKLHNPEIAEDITQEAFLRYFENYHCVTTEQALKYLYTIAKNLCIDEYRRQPVEPLHEFMQEDSKEEQILTSLVVRSALAELENAEQELLLLRYVNEVSISTIGQILGISRFAVYRKLIAVSKKFKDKLGKEEY